MNNCSVRAVQNNLLATPDGAPSVPVPALPPDTPSVSRAADNILNVSADSDEELAVLDRVLQVGGTVCSRAELSWGTLDQH